MAYAEGSPPGIQLALTAEQKKTVLAFLNDKERSKFLERWLAEWGISSFKAKVVVRVLVPALQKFLGGVAERGLDRVHETLSRHFNFYDDLSGRISVWLFYKIENRKVPEKLLKPWIENPPQGVTVEDWTALNRETKVWVEQLEKLNLITLALDDLKASVSLRIDRPGQLKREPLSRLLRAHNSLIPLFGRDRELAGLHSFADHPDGFRWLVLTGDGGVGKTRLALSFAGLREEDGWNAGLLSAEGLGHWVRHSGFPRWAPLTDTLVVVDYAASKVGTLKSLLERFAGWAMDDAAGTKLRLLLLEREGTKDGGWVNNLCSFAEGALRDHIADGLAAVQEMKAPGRGDPDQAMVQILRATFNSWASLPGPKPPQFPDLTQDDLREIRRSTEGRPLFLQMAALRACAEKNTASLARWDRTDLLKDAVGRERNYIRRFCNGDGTLTFLMERGVALLAFTGPIAKDDPRWLELLRKDFEACGHPQGQPGEVSSYIAGLLGESQANGTIIPLAPDILAEALAVSVLRDRPQAAAHALEGALDCSGNAAWINLLRAVTDTYALAEFAGLERWAEQLVNQRPAPELAALETLFPAQTVALAHVSATVYQKLLQGLPEGDNAERARIFNNLGNRYSDLGRRDEALEALKQAVEIYQRLAAKDPDAFAPILAMSLGNLGACCAQLGQREDALHAGKVAVEIYEQLAAMNPDAFGPGLAMSLNSLGTFYVDLGLREKALEAVKQAVQMYERLTAKDSDAFEPHMAGSLNNLGGCYSDLGQGAEALQATERAVEIYDRLAAKNPDAFESHLASGLNNLGRCYYNLRRWDDALQAARRAVGIRERLTAKNRDAFEPELAKGLGTLGSICLAITSAQASLIFERGVSTLSRLFLENPRVFGEIMAALVNQYKRACESVGKKPDAVLLGPINDALNKLNGS